MLGNLHVRFGERDEETRFVIELWRFIPTLPNAGADAMARAVAVLDGLRRHLHMAAPPLRAMQLTRPGRCTVAQTGARISGSGRHGAPGCTPCGPGTGPPFARRTGRRQRAHTLPGRTTGCVRDTGQTGADTGKAGFARDGLAEPIGG